MTQQKRCTKCKEFKDTSGFSKNKTTKDGFQYQCKPCFSATNKAWSDANKDYRKEQSRLWYEENKERNKATGKTWREANKEKKAAINKAWRDSHKDQIQITRTEWNKNNPNSVRLSAKKWAKKNPERVRANLRRWWKNELATNVHFKLRCAIGKRLNMVIVQNQKGGSAVRDLGCTLEQLKNHLSALFTEGMSWDNWGRGYGHWNIDHIMPLSAFDLRDRQQFLLANHYLNLQPLWYEDNMAKSDKIPYELLRTA